MDDGFGRGNWNGDIEIVIEEHGGIGMERALGITA